MRSVVELPAARHRAVETIAGYRVEMRDCFSCWRDFRVYVPQGRLEGLPIIGVPCPHCHRWEAETIIPQVSKPVLVQGCQRSWLEWQVRGMARRYRTGRAYVRIWLLSPYWALRRAMDRARAARRSAG